MIYDVKDNVDLKTGVLYHFLNRSNLTTTAHTHNYHEVFIVLQSPVVHYCNEKKEILSKNTMLLIRPEDCHYYSREGDGIFLNVAFKSEYFYEITKLLSISSFSPVLLSQAECDDIVNRFNLISGMDWKDDYTRIVLKQTLVYLLSLFARPNLQINTYPQWFSSLLDELSQTINFTQGLEKLYSLSPCTKEHTTRSFKKFLNLTPTRYLNNLKLNYAKNLLVSSGYSVTDICFAAGFNDTSYFFVLFKEKYNCSPVEYRRKYRTFLP